MRLCYPKIAIKSGIQTHPIRSASNLVCLAAVISFIGGCESFVNATQEAEILVSSDDSGIPVHSAEVQFAPDDAVGRRVYDRTLDEQISIFGEYGGATDEAGRLVLVLRPIVRGCGVGIPPCNSNPDGFLDDFFLFRVVSEAGTATVRLKLSEGATSANSSLRLTVLGVSDAIVGD